MATLPWEIVIVILISFGLGYAACTVHYWNKNGRP